MAAMARPVFYSVDDAVFLCGFPGSRVVRIPVVEVTALAGLVHVSKFRKQLHFVSCIDRLQREDSRILESSCATDECVAIVVDQFLNLLRAELDLRILRLVTRLGDL